MQLEIIQAIIKDFQSRDLPGITNREMKMPCIAFSATGIVGSRRCGKTFRTYQFIKEMMASGTPREQFCRIQFNDLRLRDFSSESLLLIDRAYYALYPGVRDKQIVYFIFDEIHRVENWEDYVLQLLDNQYHRVIITGSTSQMLIGKMASALRGKCLTSQLYGFSFREYLAYKDIVPDTISSSGQSHIQNVWNGYFESGGFSGTYALDKNQRIETLQQYWEIMLLRDVIEAHPHEKIPYPLLARLGQELISRVGSPLNTRKIMLVCRELGLSFSDELFLSLFRYMREAFAVYQVPVFSQSIRIRNRNYQKVYVCDWALAGAVAFSETLGKTRLFENLVFLELKRRGNDVSYFLTEKGYEIDFVAVGKGNNPELFQVCWSLESEAHEGELRGLPETARYLGINNATVVTAFEEDHIDNDGISINVKPAWKWLLENDTHKTG
jgi:predicted AAA+ superfamily ATPase